MLPGPIDGRRRFNVAVYLMALGLPDESSEQVRENLEIGARVVDILEAVRDFEDYR
jgi:hypothetical protein